MDILAKALEIWGPNGEHWCRGVLEHGGVYHNSYCLYGGIGKAYCGFPIYDTEAKEHRRALRLISDEINKSNPHDLGIAHAHWNDSRESFKPVKQVVCNALKQALNDEEQEEKHASF